MIPRKRSMDEVLAAIGAAMAETGGRTLDRVDAAGDAAIAAARRQVTVTLHDYQPFAGADPGDAEWRYRLELERSLHGPLAVPGAFRAWLACSESDGSGVSADERVLASAWVAASQRARAEGLRNLAESHGAWFEVRAVRAPAASGAPAVSAAPAASARRPLQASRAEPAAQAGPPRQSELF